MAWFDGPPPSRQFKVVPVEQTSYNAQQYAQPVKLFNADGSAWSSGSSDTARSLSLRNWFAALANRKYAPANVAVVGGSSSEGVGATAFGRHYFDQLRDRIRAQFPVTGVTGGQNYYPAWGSPNTGATPAYAWPVVQAGSPSNSNTTGFGLKSTALASAGQTLTLTFTGTRVDVWVGQYGGSGTISVQVDGGTATQYPTTGTNLNQIITNASLTPGSHTAVVAYVSGSPVYVRGFVTFNGDETSGIRFYNGAQASKAFADFDNAGNAPKWLGGITTIQPHLVILQSWNDYLQNVTAATAKTTLQSVISRIRGACSTNPSFVIQSGPRVDSGTYTDSWENYQAMFAQIAAADTGGPGGTSGVALFDASLRWASPVTDNTLGIYNTDLLHLTDLGHSMWADALARFISPA